jgi:phosphatidylglycerophosphatase A
MAGESLGKVISNYIAGTEGVRNFLYFRRMKREFLKKVGPFVDAAIGGLIAGTVYQICSSTARSVNEAR